MRASTAVLLATLTLGSCQTGGDVPQYKGVRTAFARLFDRSGHDVGFVEFQDAPEGVDVDAHFDRFPPGAYDLDVHERGECDARRRGPGAFASAGAALSGPFGERAGREVDVHEDGTAEVRFRMTGIRIVSGRVRLFDGDGSAVIVAGRLSGRREACGIVRP